MSLPTPYYEHAGITIYHGDCRDILLHVKADLVLTDPPYGVGLVAFNDDFSLVCPALETCHASIMACFMSPARLGQLLFGLSSWHFERVLWMEKVADLSFPWRGWLMDSEAIAIFSRPDATWPAPLVYSRDCYHVAPWGKSGHPNAKPLSVVRDIILKIGGDLILDPFMGSGTTLVAAKQLGRKAIGIEIEERYCEIAAKRLAQEVLPLDPAPPEPQQAGLLP